MLAKNKNNKNKGQVLVLVALSIFAFFGFAALAIDVGYFYHTKNQLQGAADAAALAGAAKLTCKSVDGITQLSARQEAWKYACKNVAAGQSVYLVTNSSTNCDAPPSSGLNEDTNSLDGDIVVGYWTGSFSETVPSGRAANAVQVTTRRMGGVPFAYTGGAISTFFGKIFGVSAVNISTIATARGCFPNVSPIAVNEYWMGDAGFGGGGADCKEPANSNDRREPYGIHHVYPNSFVRPSHGLPFGNVSTFKTKDCDNNTITVIENGPLQSDCAALSSESKKGRPSDPQAGDNSCPGRAFSIVGNASMPNKGSNMYGLLNFDYRIGCSKDPIESPPCTENQWYKVSNYDQFDPQPNADTNPSKDIVAGYIAAGIYPNIAPISVPEVFQPDYSDINAYPSGNPYASVSFYSGAGVTGQVIKANFWDNGQYAGGKYTPGNKINVTVYDGVVGGSGAGKQRTTIVGFARIKILGYGREIRLNADGTPTVEWSANPNEMTLYGYVENQADSLRQNIEDLEEPFVVGVSRLVR